MFDKNFKLFPLPNFAFFFHGGEHPIGRNVVVCCFSAIFVIVFYCGTKVVFASDKKPELCSGTVHRGDGLIKPVEVVFAPILVDGAEAGEFIKDGGAEL